MRDVFWGIEFPNWAIGNTCNITAVCIKVDDCKFGQTSRLHFTALLHAVYAPRSANLFCKLLIVFEFILVCTVNPL